MVRLGCLAKLFPARQRGRPEVRKKRRLRSLRKDGAARKSSPLSMRSDGDSARGLRLVLMEEKAVRTRRSMDNSEDVGRTARDFLLDMRRTDAVQIKFPTICISCPVSVGLRKKGPALSCLRARTRRSPWGRKIGTRHRPSPSPSYDPPPSPKVEKGRITTWDEPVEEEESAEESEKGEEVKPEPAVEDSYRKPWRFFNP